MVRVGPWTPVQLGESRWTARESWGPSMEIITLQKGKERLATPVNYEKAGAQQCDFINSRELYT